MDRKQGIMKNPAEKRLFSCTSEGELRTPRSEAKKKEDSDDTQSITSETILE
jgi:hypothetical protein